MAAAYFMNWCPLQDELIKEAKTLNLSYIELSATKEGEPIYQKLGFKEHISADKEMRL